MKEKQKRKLETGSLLFPFLISGAADKLSSYIDECVGEVPSLKESEPNCVSAKSLRMGSLQECAIRNVRDAADYRKWTLLKSCPIFFYKIFKHQDVEHF